MAGATTAIATAATVEEAVVPTGEAVVATTVVVAEAEVVEAVAVAAIRTMVAEAAAGEAARVMTIGVEATWEVAVVAGDLVVEVTTKNSTLPTSATILEAGEAIVVAMIAGLTWTSVPPLLETTEMTEAIEAIEVIEAIEAVVVIVGVAEASAIVVDVEAATATRRCTASRLAAHHSSRNHAEKETPSMLAI